MKLLLTLDFPPEKGGIQRLLFEKAARDYSSGDRIAVGTARRTAVRWPELACTVSWHANPLSRLSKKWSLINLLFVLLRGRGQQVECGNVYAGIAPWVLSFFRRVAYRVYAHGTELLGLPRRSLRSLLLRSVLRRADKLYVTTRYVERLVRRAGIESECVLDPPRIRLDMAAGRPERPFAAGACLELLSVGRLVPHKGHRVLLEACAGLPPEVTWRLVLAGSGPEEKNLRAIAEQKKISDRVVFKNRLTDQQAAAEYGRADIFILPSLETARGTEGFGIVLLEAMAAGVPIVASRAGGIPEVLDEGSCGVLVDPGNAGALAGAVLDLARDGARRSLLAGNALRRVRERYSWEATGAIGTPRSAVGS